MKGKYGILLARIGLAKWKKGHCTLLHSAECKWILLILWLLLILLLIRLLLFLLLLLSVDVSQNLYSPRVTTEPSQPTA